MCTCMRSNLLIDARGTAETNIYMYGAGGGLVGNAPSSARIQVSGGGVTPNSGNIDTYAKTCTYHSDLVIDPALRNLFIPVTSATGPDTALLRVFTDVGAPKLGFRWGGRSWWFTSSSNSAA